MYDNKKNNDENFWISYADLMAGLLFVFILVIGAIIIKYLYTQNDLQVMKTDLEKEKQALNLSEEELLNKKKKILSINTKLNAIKEEKIRLSFQLAKSQNSFNDTKKELEIAKEESKLLSEKLNIKDTNLKLSIEKIEKITAIIEGKDKLLEEKATKISLNDEEIEKLKALLFSYSLREKEQTELNEKLEADIEKRKATFKLKDEELALLEKQFLMQTNLHQKLVEEFDITKLKIKSLTGIKIQVISKLRKKLGSSINIDERSGAIQFSSNILFDQGQFKLKEKSKEKLSLILKKYLTTLLEDESIKKNIHSITIEGHTNSDGNYLDNLQLSQKRALEVMQFLYSSNIIDKKLLKEYVNSSGKSYSDLIYKNGVEDKDSSRRIEIKFRIKNESAIKELQKFLGDKE